MTRQETGAAPREPRPGSLPGRLAAILGGRPEGPPATPRLTTIALLLALVPLVLPLFRGLDHDLYNDEAIYAYAVDSILETGDWLTPRASLTDLPFLEKPPLKLWLTAGAIRLGLVPHDERGMRLLDAFFAALVLLYVFLIGARLVDPVAGLAAAFLMFVSPAMQLDEHGLRSCGMESMLCLQFAASVYHALAWANGQSAGRRTLHVLAISGWLAFGALAKPTALLVPLTLGLAILLVPGWRRLLWRDRWRFLAGAVLAAMLIAPWLVIQSLLHGTEFWRQFVGTQLVDRAVQGLDPDHLEPWWWYGSYLTGQLAASGAVVWVALGAGLWIVRVASGRWPEGALVPLWLAVPVGLLSISVSKLHHYIFPSLPAVFLFGGLALSVAARIGEESARWLAGSRPGSALQARAGRLRWSWLFAGAAILALAVAAALLVAGAAGHSPAAAWAAGCACLALVPSRRRGFVLAAILLTIALWPLARYADVLARLPERHAPLQAVRQCVDELGPAVKLGEGRTGTVLYMHIRRQDPLAHPYFYYFRHLDVRQRPWKKEDGPLYFRLFVEGHQAPTVIDRSDYREFLERATGEADQQAARDLLEWVREAVPESVLPDPRALEPTPALELYGTTLLLLPGPYRACWEPALAAGGRRLVH